MQQTSNIIDLQTWRPSFAVLNEMMTKWKGNWAQNKKKVLHKIYLLLRSTASRRQQIFHSFLIRMIVDVFFLFGMQPIASGHIDEEGGGVGDDLNHKFQVFYLYCKWRAELELESEIEKFKCVRDLDNDQLHRIKARQVPAWTRKCATTNEGEEEHSSG